MPSPIDDIKSRLDIVELVQSYIRLNKAGVNYKALCPFHTEKTPSFVVSPARQLWHCFGGCSEGGDIFKFVMKIEGLEFRDALELLARRAGVQLRREDPKVRSERSRLYQLIEDAVKICEITLKNTREPLSYLKKRGLTGETVQTWRLGFAPDSWDYLIRALGRAGYQPLEIEKAGLAIKSEQGSFYDRFRSRIVFPIADASGRVVGFSGRIFEGIGGSVQGIGKPGTRSPEPGAKYINTPQTLIYDKSRVLYGFDKAKEEIRKQSAAVLVEGQMDVVMSHQAGVKNCVAVSGTALSHQQLRALKRLANTLISSFDRDSAGEMATKRSLELAAGFEFERKVAGLPGDIKDPAEAVARDPEIWRRAVSNAKPIVEFILETALLRHERSAAEGKKIISREVLAEITVLASEVEKAHWIGQLAKAIGIAEEILWRELSKIKNKTEAPINLSQTQEAPAEKTRREQLEALLLGTLILYPEHLSRLRPLPRHFFSQDGHLKLLELLESAVPTEATAKIELDSALPPEFKEQASYLAFQAEVMLERIENFKERTAEIALYLKELERVWAKERLQALAGEVRLAEASQDPGRVEELLQEFRKISESIK